MKHFHSGTTHSGHGKTHDIENVILFCPSRLVRNLEERELFTERIRAGLAAAWKQGRVVGRAAHDSEQSRCRTKTV